MGANFASFLSPWLACGTLSPRKVFFELLRFEKSNGSSKDTVKYFDEVMWRDFYKYWCMHHGNRIFSEYGIHERSHYNWQTDMEIVQKWRQGQTGYPLIDALMREMNTSGYMSNRGRQIVACFFALDLK
mmetsp:Transcript_18324/g.13174  ORF Transcript_18324/g.13174 Transcript_18324/m.13174 type:complete len:129 (+) Transcript_18324:919-1305(+)